MSGTKRNRVNEEITLKELRLIGQDGAQIGVVSSEEALSAAKEASLDLVEIAPNADPPVCRLMDFGRFLFEEKKKRVEARKKQKQIHVKEIKFRPTTEEGDYQVKIRSLKRFLDAGDKAKVTLRFKGRELTHQELGISLLQRVEKDLEEISVVEQSPKMEGRQVVMVLSPKRKKGR